MLELRSRHQFAFKPGRRSTGDLRIMHMKLLSRWSPRIGAAAELTDLRGHCSTHRQNSSLLLAHKWLINALLHQQ
jgi:hypothetical protein